MLVFRFYSKEISPHSICRGIRRGDEQDGSVSERSHLTADTRTGRLGAWTANIYHFVELMDNYDRYVILLTTETSSRTKQPSSSFTIRSEVLIA